MSRAELSDKLAGATFVLREARKNCNDWAVMLVTEVARETWGAGITLKLETTDQSYVTGFWLLDVVSTADGTTVSGFDPDDFEDEDLSWALSCIDWDHLPDEKIAVP